jgi:hypothetical protein
MGKTNMWVLGGLVGVYCIADTHDGMLNQKSGTWGEGRRKMYTDIR